MTFFSIYPQYIMKIYKKMGFKHMPTKPMKLRVISDDGVNVTEDFDINITDLHNGSSTKKYKQFYSNGYGGITFKTNVLIKKKDGWDSKLTTQKVAIKKTKKKTTKKYVGKKVEHKHRTITWLNYLYKNIKPVYVVTNALDVPNGLYLISKIPSKKQDYKDSTIWELEFTTYRQFNMPMYKNNNKSIKDVIKIANKSKKNSAINVKLSKCKLKNLKYSKTKKTTKCTKLLQTVLYKKGFLKKNQIDGWYGKVTLAAVKKFQKNHNKKMGNVMKDINALYSKIAKKGKHKATKQKTKQILPVNGKVDKATLKILCGV